MMDNETNRTLLFLADHEAFVVRRRFLDETKGLEPEQVLERMLTLSLETILKMVRATMLMRDRPDYEAILEQWYYLYSTGKIPKDGNAQN